MYQFLKKYKKETIVFIVALIVNFIFFILTNIFGSGRFLWSSDAIGYFELAKNFIQYHGFYHDISWGPQALRTPVYPIFISIFYYIIPSIGFVIFIQNIISAINVYLLFKLGKLLFNEKIALVASILYILESQRIQVSSQLMSETIFIFFFLLSIYFLFKFLLYRQNLKLLIVSSVFFGLAVLTRPVIQLLFLLIVGLIIVYGYKNKALKKYLKYAGVFTLIFYLVISPWIIRNKIHFNTWKVSSAGGQTIFFSWAGSFMEDYTGRSEQLNWYKDAQKELDLNINWQDWRKESLKFMEPQYEKYFLNKGFNIIKQHPLEYSIFHLKRIATFFIESGASRSYSAMLYDMGLPSLIFYPFLFWGGRAILLFFAIVSFFGYIIGKKKIEKLPIILFLFFTFLYFAILASPNRDIPRMREPVMGIYLLLIINGIYLLKQDKNMRDHHTHESLEDVYHQVPPDYWETVYKNPLQHLWYFLRFRAIKKVLKNLANNSKILDVGCGSGFSMQESIPEEKSFEVHGVDVTEEVITYARSKRPQFNFKLAYGEELPYEDKSFDAIISLDVIEHLTDPVKALEEKKRVLRDNGFILVLVVKEHHPLFRVIWWMWLKLKGGVWHEAHLHIFDEKLLNEMVDKAGLKIDKLQKIHLGMSLLAVIRKK